MTLLRGGSVARILLRGGSVVIKKWLHLDLDRRIGRKAGPRSTNCNKEVGPFGSGSQDWWKSWSS